MSRTPLVVVAGAIAFTLGLASRLPSGSVLAGGLAIVAAASGLTFGILSTRPSRKPWTAPASLATTAILLAVPTDSNAVLQLPVVVVVAPALLYMHLLFPPHAAEVPWLAGEPHGNVRRALRLTPWMLLAYVAAMTPWLATWALPKRLGMASEVQGAPGPILVALLLATAAVVLALLLRGLGSGAVASKREGPP